MNLSKLKVAVIDLGLWGEDAVRFARDVAEVMYCCPNMDAFKLPYKDKIMHGMDGVEQVKMDAWFDRLDNMDFIWIPDNACAGLVEWLRRNDYPVGGVGYAEKLEIDRYYGREVQQKNGLPVQSTLPLVGVGQLRELMQHGGREFGRPDFPPKFYVKVDNDYRGIEESFRHDNWASSEGTLDRIAYKLGPYKEDIKFVCEELLEGEEPGLDGITWEGDLLYPTMCGYEGKGVGIIERTYRTPEELPPSMHLIHNGLSPSFKKWGTRFFYSTEVKMVGKVPFLIDPTCFDDQTEVLTDEGWKLFSKLNRREKVATLNPNTGEIEYHKPYDYQILPFNGNMVRMTSPNKSVDMCVTPNHSVWGYQRKTRKKTPTLVEIQARDLGQELRIPRTGKWVGSNPEFFTLPSYTNTWKSGLGCQHTSTFTAEELRIPIESWVKFLGIYLSEGSCNTWSVDISQYKHKEEVRELLRGFPLEVVEHKSGFRISSVQLVNYVRQFGLCSNKFVPDCVKELSPRLINMFIDAFVVGDGYVKKGGGRRFISTSLRLLGDLQELLLKVGTVGNIYPTAERGTAFCINGEWVKRRNNTYILSERVTNHHYLVDPRTTIIEDYPYNGLVYDVTVQNHILYVRRNMKPMWSGNCRKAGPGTSAIQCELISNYTEVCYGLATGERVDPVIKYKYAAACAFHSEEAINDWVRVQFPKEMRQWVKLRMACKKGGQYYAIPGFDSLGTVIGMGDSIKTAISLVEDRMEQVKCKRIDTGIEKLKEIVGSVEKGKKVGIEF